LINEVRIVRLVGRITGLARPAVRLSVSVSVPHGLVSRKCVQETPK